MCRNSDKTTSSVKYDSTFELSVPDFLYDEKFWKLDHNCRILANFLLRMCRNGYKTTSAQIFNTKFEIPMGCFLFKYEFWWRFCQDLYVFARKTAFIMQNFWNLGASDSGSEFF